MTKGRDDDDTPALPPVYSVAFTRAADKELRKLDRQAQARIVDALEDLARNPSKASSVKPLKGREGFRLRVGDYRAVYRLDDDVLVVLVVRVGHRKEVYK